jgi:hypothetical protein
MQQLLTKAAFARLAGVSYQAIGVQCAKGGQLTAAVVDGKLDAGHPDALAYLQRQKERQNTDRQATKVAKKGRRVPGMADDGSPDFIRKLQGLTLAEIGRRYGGLPQCETVIRAINQAESVREKRLKNDETEGRLIERELVAAHVFGAMEETNRRLLSDAARTITRQLYANARSGVELEKSELEVRQLLSKVLEPAPRKIAKILREAKRGG